MSISTGGLHILNVKTALNQKVIRHTNWDDVTTFKNTKMMFKTVKAVQPGQRQGVVSTVSPDVLFGSAVKTSPHILQFTSLHETSEPSRGSRVRLQMISVYFINLGAVKITTQELIIISTVTNYIT